MKPLLAWTGANEFAVYPSSISTSKDSINVFSVSDVDNSPSKSKAVDITPIEIRKPPYNVTDKVILEVTGHKTPDHPQCMEWLGGKLISLGIGRAVHIFNMEGEVAEDYLIKKISLLGGKKYIPVRRRSDNLLYYKEVTRHSSHEAPVLDISHNSVKKWLASASKDCVVRVWDLSTGKRMVDYKDHLSQVNGVAWNPIKHDLLLSGSNNEVLLVDFRNHKSPIRWGTKSMVTTVLWNQTKEHEFMINCNDGAAFVGDTRKPSNKADDGCFLAVSDADISAVSYHPTKDVYVTGSRTGVVKVWDLNSSEEPQQVKEEEQICISCLSFAPDGKNVAYCTSNQTFGVIKMSS